LKKLNPSAVLRKLKKLNPSAVLSGGWAQQTGAPENPGRFTVSNPVWEIYFTVDEHDEMVDASLFEG
jgi:hypothetical protein